MTTLFAVNAVSPSGAIEPQKVNLESIIRAFWSPSNRKWGILPGDPRGFYSLEIVDKRYAPVPLQELQRMVDVYPDLVWVDSITASGDIDRQVLNKRHITRTHQSPRGSGRWTVYLSDGSMTVVTEETANAW